MDKNLPTEATVNYTPEVLADIMSKRIEVLQRKIAGSRAVIEEWEKESDMLRASLAALMEE